MAAIEISGLSKVYAIGFWRRRSRRVLDNLTLQVEEGEVFGFLGPNGAGKTTTIKILTGLIFPSEGRATILGRPPGEPETFLQLGYLPEQPYFYDYLTPAELLAYFARFFPMTGQERRSRRGAVLEQTGLREHQNVPLRKLSKGLLQRVGIAQAILHNPRIVILDEPMSGLDPVGRREVRDLILQLKAEGKLVFFSTHILSDAEALCDRVGILNRGRLVGVGRVSELLPPQGNYEAILECSSPEHKRKLESLAVRSYSGGVQIRLEVPGRNLRELLSLCGQNGVRVISVNPSHFRLEDYFVEMVGRADRSGLVESDGEVRTRQARQKS